MNEGGRGFARRGGGREGGREGGRGGARREMSESRSAESNAGSRALNASKDPHDRPLAELERDFLSDKAIVRRWCGRKRTGGDADDAVDDNADNDDDESGDPSMFRELSEENSLDDWKRAIFEDWNSFLERESIA